MEFNIPKTFKIFNITYKVKQYVKVDDQDSWGEHDFTTRTIKIKKGLQEDDKIRTFMHEIMHCALEQLSYTKLSEDEKFVDQIGSALHQIIKTAK